MSEALAVAQPAAPYHGMPPQAYLNQLIFGFASTMIILAAAELHLFEELEKEAATSFELAARLGLKHADSLERLLNACVSYGLLEKDTAGSYSLTELSRAHLIPGKLEFMGGFFSHIKRDLLPLWENLPHAVREAQPQWDRIPGGGGKGVFETIYQDEAGLRSFMNAMFTGSYGPSCEHAATFDFSRFHHVCDVGGASGPFLAAVLPKFPHLRGTIFDLAPVEKIARETMEQFGLADRVDFHAGSFFEDEMPTGPDLFVLGHILHDWDREQGTVILEKIYRALPEGGAVFVAEMLFDENKVSPPPTVFMDVNMLCATTGRERTAAEYEVWLKEVGFSRTEHHICQNPKSYVVGYK